MNTLIRIIVSSVLSLSVFSCDFTMGFGMGVDGDGNVVTKTRDISNDFEGIKVSRGLDLYVTQGDAVSLTVEADQNLHDIITTDVINGTLKISSDENIRSSDSKKIMLTVPYFDDLDASSGAHVYGENTIRVDELWIESSSGSRVDLNIRTQNLRCDVSSGADITISGNTASLKAEASSGSRINASNLETSISHLSASSGANISTNVTKELTASASSGANINYTGNPEKVTKNKGVSGSIYSK